MSVSFNTPLPLSPIQAHRIIPPSCTMALTRATSHHVPSLLCLLYTWSTGSPVFPLLSQVFSRLHLPGMRGSLPTIATTILQITDYKFNCLLHVLCTPSCMASKLDRILPNSTSIFQVIPDLGIAPIPWTCSCPCSLPPVPLHSILPIKLRPDYSENW